MLGTSDTWSMSHSSHRPSEPVYYIEDCRIFGCCHVIPCQFSPLQYSCTAKSATQTQFWSFELEWFLKIFVWLIGVQAQDLWHDMVVAILLHTNFPLCSIPAPQKEQLKSNWSFGLMFTFCKYLVTTPQLTLQKKMMLNQI